MLMAPAWPCREPLCSPLQPCPHTRGRRTAATVRSIAALSRSAGGVTRTRWDTLPCCDVNGCVAHAMRQGAW